MVVVVVTTERGEAENGHEGVCTVQYTFAYWEILLGQQEHKNPSAVAW